MAIAYDAARATRDPGAVFIPADVVRQPQPRSPNARDPRKAGSITW